MDRARAKELDLLAFAYRPLHHADVGDRTAIVVIVRIEDHRLQRRIRIARRWRNMFDNRINQAVDAFAGLRTDAHAFVRIGAERIHHFLGDFIGPRVSQIDLVDHRNDLQIMFHRRIRIGDGLSFDALKRIDQQQCAFAAGKRPRHFVVKVDVTWRIDQVQFVVFPVVA